MSDIGEQLFHDHLGLAEIIALEYSNIPRTNVDDAMSEAQQALLEQPNPTIHRKEISHHLRRAPFETRSILFMLSSCVYRNCFLGALMRSRTGVPPAKVNSPRPDEACAIPAKTFAKRFGFGRPIPS